MCPDKAAGHTPWVNERLRIRPAGGEDADPIARLFLASKATLTFLPNIHTDEETFYFIANIVLRDLECSSLRRTVRSVASSLYTETWWSISTSVQISCAAASGVRCSSEPRSGCRRGSGCGSYRRTFRRGASTSATGSGSSRKPMAAGTRNGRRMPSTSGRPPDQRAGHKPVFGEVRNRSNGRTLPRPMRSTPWSGRIQRRANQRDGRRP